MRCKLSQDSLETLFKKLFKLDLTIENLSKRLNINPRTLRDWRRGKFTIPKNELVILVNLARIDINKLEITMLPQWWNNKDAGKIGGQSYFERYGAPGTQLSRKFGGIVSYQKRNKSDVDIFKRKHISKPGNSLELAEFIGLMIGDGSVGPYQISITLDSRTDVEYAQYVKELIRLLFDIKPSIRYRKNKNCLVIEVSSINLVEFLVGKGLPVGNKIQQHIDMPIWIKSSEKYSKACVRGIFDTDGSIFQEIHNIKKRQYSYCRMSFVSASPNLLISIYDALSNLGITAKIRNNRAVVIESFTDIKEYFKIVGSSNPKHNRRFATFGGVG